ncbi:cleavage stimulation factor subunit 3-like isoform X2 [Watersipora subatra]
MRAHNYEKVEKLFQRCLIKILSIDLWKCYLQYIKDTKASLPTFKEKMAQAYDFAIDKIGQDHYSLPIWTEYISFLKSVDAVGSYAENQRITAVRRVYQRGTVTPMHGVEHLWREYCQYETSINPIIAKKMIEERSKEYSNAKRVAREYDVHSQGIIRSVPSIPPQNTPEELRQVELWKKFIVWEKSNPLRTEDHAVVTKRVMFAYEQCLLCLGYHPDLWFEAASFLEQSSRLLSEKGDQNACKLFAEEAGNVYERGISGLLKNTLILYFAYADFEEGRLKYEKVHSIYKRYIDLEDNDPSLCYIQYMNFARRAEGIKPARAVFKMAREDKRSSYHVYVAAALMEFYCSKDKNVAYKIFELGLKRFGDNNDFIMCFVEYMLHLNEDNNTRVLFERVLTSSQLAPEKSLEVWRRFVEFESQIGDLPSINKVEKRRLAVHQGLKDFEGREASLLVERYQYLDLLPCSVPELRCLGFKDTRSAAALLHSALPAVNVVELTARDEDPDTKADFPRPDTSQMIPFKPKQIVPTGAHPVEGGVFPYPPAASQLLTTLPPPNSFIGPFVKIDKFLENFLSMKLPEALVVDDDGLANGTQDLDSGTAYSVNKANILSKKRKALVSLQDDAGSDGEADHRAPSKDIYRSRQQKRVR